MTYKQLGYWDNIRGRTSMASLLQVAQESVYKQRYLEGWNRANEQCKAKSGRDWRPINGEPELRSAAD